MFGDLSQNSTATNLARGSNWMNIEQRYLLQKYFSNEETFSISTIGATTLNTTVSPNIGAVSATLTTSWSFPTATTAVTFSDGEIRNVLFTNGSTAITWTPALVGLAFALTAAVNSGATSGVLQNAWTFTSGTYTITFSDGESKTGTFVKGSTAFSWTGGLASNVSSTIYAGVNTTTLGVGGVQFYQLPPDYSKLKTGTLTIGNLKWTPKEILSRQEWDNLNVFPYYSDIPNNFFIWNYTFGLWPIPSTSGNIITFNYKRRIPDLSLADYIMGTVTVTNGSTTVTGAGTTFITTANVVSESRYIQITAPTGDNLWYQVASVNSTSSITLVNAYQGVTASGASYTLGQMPVINEDFQDMLVYKALVFYFTSIVSDSEKAKEFQSYYDRKLELLAEYDGTKTVNVNLARTYAQRNPNLYPQNIGL